MYGEDYDRNDPTSRENSISLADLSTLLGAHIAVCSSPELSIDEKTNFMKVIEQLPRHMKSAHSHRVTSLVDFAGSTSGQLCSNKICGVDEFNKAITHAKDFDRDLTATKEYKEYRNFHAEDFEAKAKDTGKNIEELAKKGFAIKNSQWNSYWRGKVAGGLCMTLTMTAGKSISNRTLEKELRIGELQKDSSDLRAVIAVMIDGGPVTQQEQREMPQICDDVVFDLRRQGYDWASNAHVLLVRFPDVQTMLQSLDGEKNLCRSQRFEMKQKDKSWHFDQQNQHNLCWECKESAHFLCSAGASLFEQKWGEVHFFGSARASLFEQKWEEALQYDEHISGMNLYQAAASGDAEGVKRVLRSKVRLTDLSESGETALHALAAVGDSTSMRLLLGELKDDEERKAYPKQFKDDDERQEYVNKGNNRGRTPLFLAQNEGVATLLIQSNAEVDKVDKAGQIPLHSAACKGYERVATLLLQSKAEVDKVDKLGQTPLDIAADTGNEGVATLLLQSNAEVDKVNGDGNTPLHDALRWGKEGMATLLLQSKADVDKVGKFGRTPLHLAENEGVATLLIQSKVEVDKVDNHGQTPLHLAAYWGREGMATLLLQSKAEVDKKDEDGQTPLHVSIKSFKDEVSKLLLGAKASVNTLNGEGNTPLHDALRYGQKGVATLLLQSKADVDKVDKWGPAMHGYS